MLRASETNEAASEAHVTKTSSWSVEGRYNTQKHDKHHDGALSTMSDWSHQLVASAAFALNITQGVGLQ